MQNLNVKHPNLLFFVPKVCEFGASERLIHLVGVQRRVFLMKKFGASERLAQLLGLQLGVFLMKDFGASERLAQLLVLKLERNGGSFSLKGRDNEIK